MTNVVDKELRFMSLNANGLSDTTKRGMLFKELRKYKSSIFCIQETHFPEHLLPVIKCQWGADGVVLAGDASNMCGVALLCSKDLNVQINIIQKDRCGRYIIAEIIIGVLKWIVVNVYFPTSNYERAQIQLVKNLSELLDDYIGENILLLGDFNVCLNEELDRFNHSAVDIRNANFRTELLYLFENFSLVDIWRQRNPLKNVLLGVGVQKPPDSTISLYHMPLQVLFYVFAVRIVPSQTIVSYLLLWEKNRLKEVQVFGN